MTWTIHGYIDGVAYSLAVGDTIDAVDGTDNALRLLYEHEGEELAATPTGPTMRLNSGDPESVLCAFTALTEITSIDGDPPDLFGPAEPGVVY